MMNLKLTSIGLLSVALLAVGCNEKIKKEETTTTSEEKMVDTHSSENSLDWNGTYKGTLPCADCEGIETSLLLNLDKTYIVTTTYLGKEGKPSEKSGSFKWNAKGNQITLDGDKNQQYVVGENTLTKIDNEGTIIEGTLANQYVLSKEQMISDEALTGKKWRLVKLMGQPVSEIGKAASKPFIAFSAQENRVSGNAGCNSFTGSYTLKEGNRFETSKLASTMKACLDMKVESQFMGVLEKADTYTIKDGELSITKARMAPLAVFELAE